ncbi:hypothetical protein D3C76_674520 [compost metagenome]
MKHFPRALIDLDIFETLLEQISLDRWNEGAPIAPRDEADLAVRHCTGGDCTDRGLRVAGLECQHLQGIPAKDTLNRGQPGLAPCRIDQRITGAARGQRDCAQGTANRFGDGGGFQASDLHLAMSVDQAGQSIGQYDTRVAQQTTPVAGMVCAFSQVYPQLEVERPSGPQENGRLIRAQAGAIGGNEHVGGELLTVFGAKLTQAWRARLFAHFQQQLDIKAQITLTGFEHLLQSRQVDQVLPFVIRGAATIPAFALDHDFPGGEAVAPLRVIAAHYIAVAVDQQCRQMRSLDSAAHQQWPMTRNRVGVNATGKPHWRDEGLNEVFQVILQLGQPSRLLAFGVLGHTALQQGEKGTAVVGLGDVFDGKRAAQELFPFPVRRAAALYARQ